MAKHSLIFIFIHNRMNYAIIVAGGKGTRMGNDIPKQFLVLHDKPVLMHTIERFYNYDTTIKIIVVLPSFQIDYWNELCAKYSFNIEHRCVVGGDERFHSVSKGLAMVDDDDAIVAIHDGVRPLVSYNTIKQCFSTAAEKGNAVPSIAVADSVRITNGENNEAIDRTSVRLIQTPQTFRFNVLKNAYQQKWHSGLTDDATVVESLGIKIQLVKGNKENIKITNPVDLQIAEILIKSGII